MAYEQEIKLLAEKDALKVEYTANAQNGDKQLVRQWPATRADLVSSALTFLNTYGSADNYPDPKTVVVTPKADKKEFPGTWRVVENRGVRKKTDRVEEQGIFQTLRLGYLETIEATPANWTEARLVQDKQQQQTGNVEGDSEKYLHAQFKNVSPLKLKALTAGLNATTFTNPTIKEQVYTGVWNNLVVASSLAEDGSGIIDIFMGNPQYRLTAFQNLSTSKQADVVYLYGVPKNLAQGIITAWKDVNKVGSSTTSSYNTTASTVDLILRSRTAGTKVEKTGDVTEWNCKYKTTTDYHWGLTLAEADALVLTKPPDGQTWILSRNYDESEGTWSVTIKKRVRQVQNVAEYTSEISAARTRTTQEKLGTTTATDLSIGSQEAGKIKRRSLTKNDDCSNDIRLDSDTVQDQTKTSYTDNAAESSTSELHTENNTALSTPTADVGETKSNTNTPTESGKTRTVESVRTSKDQQVKFRSRKTGRSTSNSIGYRNSRSVIETPEDVAYSQYIANSSLNDDDTYDGGLTYRKVDPATLFFSSRSAAVEDSGEYQYSRRRSKTDAPAFAQGFQYQVSNSLNEDDDTYDGRLLYQYSKPKKFQFRSISSAASAGYQYDYARSRDILQSPEAVQGSVFRTNNILVEADGTYDSGLSVEIPKDQVSNRSSATAAVVSTTEEHSEAIYPLANATASSGYSRRTVSTQTPSGQYHTEYGQDYAVNQTAISGETSAAKKTVRTVNTQFGYVPTYQYDTIGTTRRVRAEPTSVGLYRISQEDQTDIDQSMYSNEQNAFQKTKSTIHTASSSMLDEPSEVSGYQYSRDNRVRPSGLYYTNQTDKTALAKSISFTAEIGDSRTVYMYKYKNADALPNAEVESGAEVKIQGDMNDFKLYDYNKTVNVSKMPLSCPEAVSWVEVGGFIWDIVTTYPLASPFKDGYISQIRQMYWRYTNTIAFYKTVELAKVAGEAPLAAATAAGYRFTYDISHVSDNLWQATQVLREPVYTGTYVNFTAPE